MCIDGACGHFTPPHETAPARSPEDRGAETLFMMLSPKLFGLLTMLSDGRGITLEEVAKVIGRDPMMAMLGVMALESWGIVNIDGERHAVTIGELGTEVVKLAGRIGAYSSKDQTARRRSNAVQMADMVSAALHLV